MKRLTKRREAQPYPNLAGKVICEYKECDSTKSCENCIHGRYKDRLAAYEDILGDEYDLEKLKELVQAKREGRCVMLPITVPGRGWTCRDGFPTAISAYYPFPSSVLRSMESGYVFGKTKDDAEAALRREQDEQIKP